MTHFWHIFLEIYYRRNYLRFLRNRNSLESSQRKILGQIMKNLRHTQLHNLRHSRYENLTDIVPLQNYSDYQCAIEQQRNSGQSIISKRTHRFESTSGSTDSRKWIPYTSDFLGEINSAAGVWIADLFNQYPLIKKGRHYWSLSWLPTELRQYSNADDSDLFPFLERVMLKKTQVVPPAISKIETSAAAWWATLVYLASATDLTFISVWSPTFLLKIVSDLKKLWPQISQALNTGDWGQYDEQIRRHLGECPVRPNLDFSTESPDFLKKLWPHLALISCWDSSTSATWAHELRTLFSPVPIQGKGLWATEGVVSIPVEGKKVLSYLSHFYEFRDLTTQQIVPSWKLELNKYYQPILWTSSGLLRYPLLDRIKVTGFWGQIPILDFVGRLSGTDLVGEKLDIDAVAKVFETLKFSGPLTLVAVRKPTPHYVLLYKDSRPQNLDEELSCWHHYRVAREIGQLECAKSIRIDSLDTYWNLLNRSPELGQNKIELLIERDGLTI
jgi:hypothetical protein